MDESEKQQYDSLSDQEAQAKFNELDKQINQLEDKRQTHTKEFVELLRQKLMVSERLKRYTEVNNCEMRIRFIEARMRGEEMPHTEYVNLERKERRKVRNRVNSMMLFFVALVVIMIGSVPMLKMLVDRKQQIDDEINGTSENAAQISPEQANLTEEINASTPGEKIEVANFLQDGRTTIFDFHSAHCPACVGSMRVYQRLAAKYPEMKFYTVDIDRPFSEAIDFESPVAQQFNLHSLPTYSIYEGTQLKATGKEAMARLREMLSAPR